MKKKYVIMLILLIPCILAFGFSKSGTGTSNNPAKVKLKPFSSEISSKLNAYNIEISKFDINSNENTKGIIQEKASKLRASTSTFSGTGNWNSPGNWNNGIPLAASNAIIDGNCTVTGNCEVTDLTINAGAVLTISSGHYLKVSGTLLNNAGTSGLILKSDASGTGMLNNNTTGVQATIEQYLVKDQWHFIGIPVNYIADANDVFHYCYLAWIDESNSYSGLESGWQYLQKGDSLGALHGYAVQYNPSSSNNDTTITFTGTLNTGTIDTTFDSETEGWNFISNPYPTTIDWDASSGKELFRTNDAFYIWNQNLNSGIGDYGSYGSYVSGGSTNGQTQYIAPMQGFFVEVWHVIAGITLNNNMKVNTTTSFKSISSSTQIKLAVTDNDINYDEMLFRIIKGSTEKFDSKFDAHKLKALQSKQPLLYSIMDGEEFSINSIPSLSEDQIIPLNVIVKTSGTQKIVLRDLENYNYSYPIALFDINGNFLKDLQTGEYSFYANEGETISFYMAFKSSTITSITKTNANNFYVFSKGQNLIVRGLNGTPSRVKIVSTNGMIIFNNMVLSNEISVPILQKGVYIVTVSDQKHATSCRKTIVAF